MGYGETWNQTKRGEENERENIYNNIMYIFNTSLSVLRLELFYLQVLYGLYKLACWLASKKVTKWAQKQELFL
jgi:hypothetical protein